MSLLVAALIGFEIRSEHHLDDVAELLKHAQAPILQAQKLALMQQYDQTLKFQKQVGEQLKWVKSMREDLLQLAPGDPEASAIIAELKLQPQKAETAK